MGPNLCSVKCLNRWTASRDQKQETESGPKAFIVSYYLMHTESKNKDTLGDSLVVFCWSDLFPDDLLMLWPQKELNKPSAYK